jgi:hypothetical protein
MKTVATSCLLFAIGVGVNLTFGRRGFLPLDQSIVFDGGWRLVSGQVPFHDFVAPSGLVPSAIQAAFVSVLGVTWFAYCLHASIVNGLFAIAVYGLLRACGATRVEAGGAGALSACFFYPPAGTPFMDQHSFFFMTLMFLAVAWGTVGAGTTELIAWFAVPILFTLGYLSGQIPVAFGAVAVAVWVAVQPRRAPRWLAALAAGTAFAACCLVAVHAVWPLDWSAAWTYTVALPLQVAGDRTARPGAIGPLRMVLATLVRFPLWVKMWSLDLALVAAIPLVFVRRSRPHWALQVWLLVTCIVTTAAFLAFTRTLMQTGLALTMVIVGVAIVGVRETLPGAMAAPLIAFMGLAAVRDTVVFAATVDIPRLEHVQFNAAEADRAVGHLPPGLEFMRWSRGPSGYDADELTALVRFLRESDGNFLLVGDSSILYGLTGKPSVSPVLWMDPRLTMPHPEAPEFVAFERDLIERARRAGVRRIVLDRPKTWTHLTFDHFPQLVALTKNGGCGVRSFGGARVLEICPAS